MAARYCVECGNLVTTAFCPSCGALQPTVPDGSDQRGSGDYDNWRRVEADQPTGRLFAPEEGEDLSPPIIGGAAAAENVGPSTGAQPWHPFEQPSWYSDFADPRTTDREATQQVWNPQSAPDSGPDFMGVSTWHAEQPPTPPETRQNWILGGLAALAVIAVLVAVAFIVIRSQRTDSAIPVQPSTTEQTSTTVSTTSVPTSPPGSESVPAPAVPVTVTTSDTSAAVTSDTAGSSSASTSPDNPLGGPARDIACGAAFIVQIASGTNEASFAARVAELRAAGQLPADVYVANTSTSCAIFSSQTNSVVLYAGPFNDQYAGCAARLTGAPDSFIKGTTPETAKQYISCLCPAQVVTLPSFTAVGQTGVWVGELQRVLANKLNYKIPDLAANWGVFTQTTSDAVKQFQTDKGLPVTGQLDAVTWQGLQTAEC